MDSINTHETKTKNKRKIIIPLVIAAVALIVAVVIIVVTAGVALPSNSYRVIKVKDLTGNVSIQREEEGTFDAFEGLQLISEDKATVASESSLELLADSDKHIAASQNTAFMIKSSGTKDSCCLPRKMRKVGNNGITRNLAG